MNPMASQKRVPPEPDESALRDKRDKHRELRFELSHNLQSSLDIKATLEHFLSKVNDVVFVNGLRYVAPEQEKAVEVGAIQRHHANYTIHVENECLGALSFTRNKAFLEPELAALEMLTGIVLYPLRNALLYQKALQNSLRDTLTGIGNRAALDSHFEREIKLAQRHQQKLSLLAIDIDHFKQVNDTLGHAAGDLFLQHVAQNLQQELRETDQVFRFGGEEFVVLLSNTGLNYAQLTAERLRTKIASTPITLDNHEHRIHVSIGVSESTEDDSTQTLFKRADTALYHAKKKGRNRVEVKIAQPEITIKCLG